jgi:hypothetical protein
MKALPKQESYFYEDSQVLAKPSGSYNIPVSSTFPDIDSFVKPKAVFQMTVSTTHPYVAGRLSKKLQAYSFENDIYFIYVVPADTIDDFPFQKPIINKAYPQIGKKVRQFVIGIDESELGLIEEERSSFNE